MAFTVKHAFVSAKADGVDTSFVQPSNWNASHTISFTGDGVLLGRAIGAGAGVAQEINIADLAVPTGAVMPFANAIAPTGWLLCFGQAVSRTTFAALFAVCGGSFGAGDGSTTFNVPDMRGRVGVGKDDMGGVAANRITAAIIAGSPTVGAAGGSQTSTTTTTVNGSTSGALGGFTSGPGTFDFQDGPGSIRTVPNQFASLSLTTTGTLPVTASGTSAAFSVVQPSLVLAQIIKT